MVNNSPTLPRRSPIVLLTALLSFWAGALVFVPAQAGEVESPNNPFGYEDADQVDYENMNQEDYQDLTDEKSVNDNSLDYEQDNEYENDNQYEYKDQDDFNYRDMN
ncbi:hypothetical protein [Synechocystis sp. LEGE 06083]|uniref:hypothetical protein n=1 Tax=Synechocystis sp. LEGE 06083 TaxID=915336 RepID=UPI001D13C7C6|nr:hypothetical protein [Synechocystis sp. LEGE 06083]